MQVAHGLKSPTKIHALISARKAPCLCRSSQRARAPTSFGGYRVGDFEISAAFDVSAAKVGRDVAEAIAAPPNNTFCFAEVKPIGVLVRRGPTCATLHCTRSNFRS